MPTADSSIASGTVTVNAAPTVDFTFTPASPVKTQHGHVHGHRDR